MVNNMCVICQVQEQTINQLFFMCKEVNKIWYLFDLWIGVQSIHHYKVK